MKTIVVLFVVAVSSCSAIGALDVGDVGVGDVAGGGTPDVQNNGVINGMKESSFLIRFAALLCTYEAAMGQLTDQQLEDLLKSITKVLRESTGFGDDILGIVHLKQIGRTTAEILKSVVTILKPIVEGGLSEATFKAICKLTKKLFNPNCLPLLIKGDLSKLIMDLGLVCPNKDASIVMEDLKVVLQRFSCFFGEGPLADVQLDDPETPVLRLTVEVLCTLVDTVFQGVSK